MAQKPDELDVDNEDALNEDTSPVDGEGPANEGAQETGDLEVVLVPDDEKVEDDPEETEGADLKDPDEEPELEEEAEPGDEPLDDEAKTYSKNVQKRIQREQRLRRKDREESQQAVLAERQRSIGLERESLASKKTANEMVLVNLEFLIKDKQSALKKAKEDGNTDKEVEISGEISDLQGRKREQENYKSHIETEATQFEERAKVAVVPQEKKELAPAAQNWIGRNKWMAHSAFKAEAVYVGVLDRQLAKTVSPTDPRYFSELDKLISREMPLLKSKIQALSKRPSTNSEPVRSSVAPGGRSAPGKNSAVRSTPQRVVLDKNDKAEMIRYKMDPNNKAHQVAYAREKLNTK